VSYDNVGVDAPAYLLTGYLSGGDYQRNKQIVYMTAHFKKTETFVPPPIISGTLGDWIYSFPVEYTYTYTGGVSPVSFDVSSGNLPSGLSLDDSTGEVSGQYAIFGPKTNYTIRITDSEGSSGVVNDSSQIWLPYVISSQYTFGLKIWDQEFFTIVNTPRQVFDDPVYPNNIDCYTSLANQNSILGLGRNQSTNMPEAVLYTAGPRAFSNSNIILDLGSFTPATAYFTIRSTNTSPNGTKVLWTITQNTVLFSYDGTTLKYLDSTTWDTGVGETAFSPSGNFYCGLLTEPYANNELISVYDCSGSSISKINSSLPGATTTTATPLHISWVPSSTYPITDVLCYTMAHYLNNTSTTYVVQVNADGTLTTLYTGTNVLGTFDEINTVRSMRTMAWYNSSTAYLQVAIGTKLLLRTVEWDGTSISKKYEDFDLESNSSQSYNLYVSGVASLGEMPYILLGHGGKSVTLSGDKPTNLYTQPLDDSNRNAEFKLLLHT
jgi:hypothetical protein